MAAGDGARRNAPWVVAAPALATGNNVMRGNACGRSPPAHVVGVTVRSDCAAINATCSCSSSPGSNQERDARGAA